MKDKMYFFFHMINFVFIKHMQKTLEFPIKSVFMYRIKGGMKKGGGLLTQNCFESG